MERLQSIPKSWIYVILLIVLAGPLLRPIGIPIPISSDIRKSFEAVDSLAPGSVVVFGFDYSPGSAAEMEPQAMAILEHLAEKQVKVIGISFQAQGPEMATKAFSATSWAEKEYGVDYVNLVTGRWTSGSCGFRHRHSRNLQHRLFRQAQFVFPYYAGYQDCRGYRHDHHHRTWTAWS